MEIVNRCLNLEEFKTYVSEYYFGSEPADKLVIHHTWEPTAKKWRGQRTIEGLKKYYEGKGWSAGPHLFIYRDDIWLFSPMRQDGIHARSLNHLSIGIEVVGNYDYCKWKGKTKSTALGVIRILMDQLKIPEKEIYFHRDVSPKTCPGKMITREWLLDELKKV
jgi:hypothetical protein